METLMVPTVLGPLHVRRHGAGGVPAVLWHSLFVDGRSWDGVVPALASERELFVVDGPDHGRSPGPARRVRYDIDRCAQAAHELLEALQLPEVHWVGNAWGGHVGVALAARGEPRLRSVAALCSPMQALRGVERLKAWVLVQGFRAVGPRPWLFQQLLQALTLPEVCAARPEVARYIAGALQVQERWHLLRAMRSVMLGRRSLVERLGRVQVPALFVTATKNAAWPPELAREHAARLPHGRLVLLESARHLPPLEAADVTARLLSSWLQEVEGHSAVEPARPPAEQELHAP